MTKTGALFLTEAQIQEAQIKEAYSQATRRYWKSIADEVQARQTQSDKKGAMEMTKAAPVNETVSPVIRTSAGLRDMLFDELDSLRSGQSNPTIANAKARIASGIVETVRMELEVQQFVHKHKAGSNGPLGSPLALGESR